MLHRIMTNNDLEALNDKIPPLQISNSIVVNKKFNKQSSKLHSQGSCEILADQNSNSNSDESSESTTESSSSSSSSSGDQRTMDAADTLLSIANTPTTEFKAFLAVADSANNMVLCEEKNNNKNFEIVRHVFLLI